MSGDGLERPHTLPQRRCREREGGCARAQRASHHRSPPSRCPQPRPDVDPQPVSLTDDLKVYKAKRPRVATGSAAAPAPAGVVAPAALAQDTAQAAPLEVAEGASSFALPEESPQETTPPLHTPLGAARSARPMTAVGRTTRHGSCRSGSEPISDWATYGETSERSARTKEPRHPITSPAGPAPLGSREGSFGTWSPGPAGGPTAHQRAVQSSASCCR